MRCWARLAWGAPFSARFPENLTLQSVWGQRRISLVRCAPFRPTQDSGGPEDNTLLRSRSQHRARPRTNADTQRTSSKLSSIWRTASRDLGTLAPPLARLCSRQRVMHLREYFRGTGEWRYRGVEGKHKPNTGAERRERT